jgi:hypothetical protein
MVFIFKYHDQTPCIRHLAGAPLLILFPEGAKKFAKSKGVLKMLPLGEGRDGMARSTDRARIIGSPAVYEERRKSTLTEALPLRRLVELR